MTPPLPSIAASAAELRQIECSRDSDDDLAARPLRLETRERCVDLGEREGRVDHGAETTFDHEGGEAREIGAARADHDEAFLPPEEPAHEVAGDAGGARHGADEP